MSSTPRILVTANEIALRLGMKVSTVSNWRRRYDGSFPAPALTDDVGKRAKFDLEEVTAWLARNPQIAKSGDAPANEVAVNLARLEKPTVVADLGGAIAVLITYLRSTGARLEDTNESSIRAMLAGEGLPPEVAELVKIDALPVLVDTSTKNIFDDLAGQGNLADTYDAIISESVRRSGDSGEFNTQTVLADFLLALAGQAAFDTVYDPAAGSGGLLVEAARRGNVNRVLGVELNPHAVVLARRRMFVHKIAATIYHADSLSADPVGSELVDLVITDPPLSGYLRATAYPAWEFGTPPKISSDTAWMQHAVAHLKPGGRAIVVTAMATLSQSGPAALIRNEMLRRGAVQAVFTVPAKLRSKTIIRLAVWVLTRPDRADRRSSVLLVDAGVNDYSTIAPDGVAVNSFASWLQGDKSQLDPAVAVSVAVTELLAPDASLEPRRWLTNPTESRSGEQWMLEAKTAYQAVQHREPEPEIPELVMNPSAGLGLPLSVGELMKLGYISIIRGRQEERGAASTGGTYPRLELKYVQSSLTPDDRLAEQVTRTDASRAQLAQPGDVVVFADGGTVKARVWREQGWVLGRFMQVLRVKNHEFIDPEFLAAAVSNPMNDRYLSTTAIRTQFDLKLFQIVLPPLSVQKDLAHVLARLASARTAHEAAIELLRAAEATLADAVTSGRLEVQAQY